VVSPERVCGKNWRGTRAGSASRCGQRRAARRGAAGADVALEAAATASRAASNPLAKPMTGTRGRDRLIVLRRRRTRPRSYVRGSKRGPDVAPSGFVKGPAVRGQCRPPQWLRRVAGTASATALSANRCCDFLGALRPLVMWMRQRDDLEGVGEKVPLVQRVEDRLSAWISSLCVDPFRGANGPFYRRRVVRFSACSVGEP
jgi:hypothetical protein